jgi:hypothetical protein
VSTMDGEKSKRCFSNSIWAVAVVVGAMLHANVLVVFCKRSLNKSIFCGCIGGYMGFVWINYV